MSAVAASRSWRRLRPQAAPGAGSEGLAGGARPPVPEPEIDAEAEAILAAAEEASTPRATAALEGWWAEADTSEDDVDGIRGKSSGPDEPSHSAVEPGLPALLPSDEADASGDDCSAAGACLATCSACGSTHCVGFDVAELGIDFQCGLAGMECAGSPTPAGQPTGAPLPAADERAGSESLSAEERNELFKRFALQSEVKGSLAHNVQHLVGRSEMPKVRYRDNQVVTHKGERFIRQDRNPSIAAGCSIGGVLGARKLGRQGLGLKKRPKEEVDRVCISNKERAHTKKDAGHKEPQDQL